ncbi:hypothetical protein QFZ52_000399 [Arthrobacter woluwensis]|nr:hypothetical protein [Arthrobacter woluwensis]
MPDFGVVREVHQVLDHLLARVVGRVRLARDHELHRMLRVQEDPPEPFRIPQHEGQTLVRGHATGEPDGQDVGVEHAVRPPEFGIGRAAFLPGGPQATPHIRHQLAAQLPAQGPERLIRHVVRQIPAAQGLGLRSEGVPRQGADAGVHPGGDVHAVRDGADRYFGFLEPRPEAREHAARDLAVQLGDAVGALGQSETHDGHVELAGIAAVVALPSEVQDPVHGDSGGQARPEEVLDLGQFEAVDSRRHRGVGGEDRRRPARGQGLVPAQTLARHELLDALDAEESRVALIRVEDLRRGGARQAGVGAQGLHAAHAEGAVPVGGGGPRRLRRADP